MEHRSMPPDGRLPSRRHAPKSMGHALMAMAMLTLVVPLLITSCSTAWTVGPWNCVVRGIDNTEEPPEWANERVAIPYSQDVTTSGQACALAIAEGQDRGLTNVKCIQCSIGACPKLRTPPRHRGHGDGLGVAAEADTCGGGGGGVGGSSGGEGGATGAGGATAGTGVGGASVSTNASTSTTVGVGGAASATSAASGDTTTVGAGGGQAKPAPR